MRSAAADWQTAALKMTNCNRQHRRIGAVIDRQLHTDLVNVDVPHNAGAGDIQCIFIAVDLLPLEQRLRKLRQTRVIVFRFGKQFRIIIHRDRRNSFFIVRDGARLRLGVPVIADRRVQQHGQTHEKDEDQYNIEKAALFLHRLLPAAVFGSGGAGAPPCRVSDSARFLQKALLRRITCLRAPFCGSRAQQLRRA